MGNNGKNPSETEELRKRLELSIMSELEQKELGGTDIPNKEEIIKEKVDRAMEKVREISYPKQRLQIIRNRGTQTTTPLKVEAKHGSGDYIVFKKARIICRTVFSQFKHEWVDRTQVKERVKLIGIEALEKIREITQEETKQGSVKPILEIEDGLIIEELAELISCCKSTVRKGYRGIENLRKSRDHCGFFVLGIEE